MRKKRAERIRRQENHLAQILNEPDEWSSQRVKESSEHFGLCLYTQRLRFCFWPKLGRNCADETRISRKGDNGVGRARDKPGCGCDRLCNAAREWPRAGDRAPKSYPARQGLQRKLPIRASALKLRTPHCDAKRNAIARVAELSRCRSWKMSILRAKPVFFAAALLFFAGCQTESTGIQNAKIAMAQRIAAEPAGDYYIGRRYFKPDFKFWGYVRRPNQPWSTAQLVMLNEKQKLAPDRAALKFGSDNNYEYKLYGNFSGDKVYEPASNRVYPEFILKDYEVISTNPAPIFRTQISGRP